MLTSWVSWRWGLFINVPIGIALVWLAPRHLPETEPRPGLALAVVVVLRRVAVRATAVAAEVAA
jgi:MFS family permease